MTSGDRPTVVFVLPDARRLGFQLRMNRGGTYLEQVRQAVAILEEAHEGDVPDAPAPRSNDRGEPCRRDRDYDAPPGKAQHDPAGTGNVVALG